MSMSLLLLLERASAKRSAVIALEEEELDGFIKKKPVLMVEVYSPTCPHCKALAPEYEKAAETAVTSKKGYTFAKIDATANPGINQKLLVSGYPTLRLFVNGVRIDYDGNRTADAMLSFMDKKSGPQSTLLSTAEEIKAVVNAKGLRVCAKAQRVVHNG